MMLLKCCTEYANKYGKLNSGHRTGKGQFSYNPKEGQCQRMFKLLHNCAHFTYWQSNVQNPSSRLQQCMNQELPDVQAGFRKGRGTRDQVTNSHWIIEKQGNSRKNICFIDYTKAFDCVDHNKLWKILKEIGVLNHLTCFLRNLYAGQEATVRTGHGATDWFKIGIGVRQGCILSPCLFNLYTEYIMLNARLDEYKVESRLQGEISITSDMQMTPPL